MKICFSLFVVVLAVFSFVKAERDCKYPEFKDKVVLVTGGTSGIGYGTALKFARCGAKVVIAARDSHPTWFNGSAAENNINSDEVVKKAGGRARFVKADMHVKKDIARVMESILENEKDLHIAFNNAAITGPLTTLDHYSSYLGGEYDSLSMNTYHVIHSTAAEVRMWKKLNHSGIIINTASDNGFVGGAGASFYCGSKSSIIGFTRSTALRYITGGQGVPQVRINALAPGLIDTSFTWQQVKWMEDGKTQPWEGEYITPDHPLWEKWGPLWVNKLPGKRIGKPSEMADVVLYLASDKARYVTGTVVLADFAAVATSNVS